MGKQTLLAPSDSIQLNRAITILCYCRARGDKQKNNSYYANVISIMSDLYPIHIIHHLPKTGGVSLRNWLIQHLGFHHGMIHYGVAGELLCIQHKLPFLEQLPAEFLQGVEVVMGHYVTEATANFFPGREVRRLIVLREPAKRLISQYNHAMHYWCREMNRPQINFYEWFERYAVTHYDYKDAIRSHGLTPEISFQSQASLGPNYMAKFISQNFGKTDWPALPPEEWATQINSLLESFWCVGILEKLGDFAVMLGAALDIPTELPHENRGNQRGVYVEPDTTLLDFIRLNNPVDFMIYDHWKTRSTEVQT